VQLKLATRAGHPLAELQKRVEEITADRLARIPALVDDLVAGNVAIY
jgi:hypothetical protein